MAWVESRMGAHVAIAADQQPLGFSEATLLVRDNEG
jgi:hypothetical protein